uniref:Uncharacterized protein n=1 Tax=Zea mays TaxID=4577 RepID=A0A804M6R3_MAIZE
MYLLSQRALVVHSPTVCSTAGLTAVVAPSTTRLCPLMKAAWSDARNSAASATSSARSTFPCRTLCGTVMASSSRGPTPMSAQLRGVATPPGDTQLTRTPCRPSSPAAARTRPSSACLDAVYDAGPNPPCSDATLAVHTMAPPPDAIARAACFTHAAAPRKLTAITRSSSARSMSITDPVGSSTPALLSITSSRPCAATARATVASTCASSVTSHRAYAHRGPTDAATASPSASCTSAITTVAPLEANSRAAASPIPLAPPVTMATFPSNLRSPTNAEVSEPVAAVKPNKNNAWTPPASSTLTLAWTWPMLASY